MALGEKIILLRKKEGLSQEELAEKLKVSRQTVSKWEINLTTPSLEKAKILAEIFNISYDSLISESPINGDLTNIELIVDEIDWTKAWSSKYPILATYGGIKGIEKYIKAFDETYFSFKNDYPDINETDAFLILKDILYRKYKEVKKKK